LLNSIASGCRETDSMRIEVMSLKFWDHVTSVTWPFNSP